MCHHCIVIMTFWRLFVAKTFRNMIQTQTTLSSGHGGRCTESVNAEQTAMTKTPHHTDRQRQGQKRGGKGRWSVGQPGMGEVYHLSLLCGEAWMDSSCQTSIYRASWRNSPPRPGRTPALQRLLRTASLHWWTSPGTFDRKTVTISGGRSCVIHNSWFEHNTLSRKRACIVLSQGWTRNSWTSLIINIFIRKRKFKKLCTKKLKSWRDELYKRKQKQLKRAQQARILNRDCGKK